MSDCDRPCDVEAFDAETDRTTWLNAKVRVLTPAEVILVEAYRAGALMVAPVTVPVVMTPRRPTLEIVTADYRGPQTPCDVA